MEAGWIGKTKSGDGDDDMTTRGDSEFAVDIAPTLFFEKPTAEAVAK